ncbi:Putative glycosyltransferase CsbB [Planctomycetes bacterium Pan216]|uniref:Glycosyltransferase CsbB n=1 Tax=Kolteria novifilia TaxID=2527975 RepID=A0A518B6C4_9BACT|nr:Putative glycosyltransferase CsbB [Planctomycetes bacterium Pan216]
MTYKLTHVPGSNRETSTPLVSVVVPCYNEFAVLDRLHERLTAAARKWEEAYEIILVDDGSRHETWEKVEEIASRDPHWRVIRFARNFGHQAAVSAGIAHASGDAVIVIDADLQDPPEELHRFIAKWREGYEVVYAVRRKRKENALKRFCYFAFYRVLARMSETPIAIDSGDFCLMDRKVVDVLNSMPEQHRFVRGMRAWIGFRQVGLEYERHGRAAGEPQYTFRKLVNLAVDGIFSFSSEPLRLATRLGFLVSSVAFCGAVFTLVQRVFRESFAKIGMEPVPGFATIVIAILFLGGIQLLCLGIVGEYIGRIYDQVKGRPLWIVRETMGFEESSSNAQDRSSVPPNRYGRSA